MLVDRVLMGEVHTMIPKRWIVPIGIACVAVVSACDLQSEGSKSGEAQGKSSTKTVPDQVMPTGDRYGGSAGAGAVPEPAPAPAP